MTEPEKSLQGLVCLIESKEKPNTKHQKPRFFCKIYRLALKDKPINPGSGLVKHLE